jgi:heat shock protein HslJ
MKRVLAALALGCHACAGTRAAAPTIDELKNMTYTGLGERLGPVTLQNGRWAGDPPLAGAASRPLVALADSSRVVGDLDGDGAEEAVVLLTYSAGGSATWSFLAVVARENGTLRNVATTALGDRVQVRSARIDGGRLLVNGVRAGANDPACCPSDLVEWQWTLGAGRLNALSITSAGRLAPLGGTSWQLVRFQGGDDTILTPDDKAKYTLAFGTDSGLSARIDCNRGRGTWTSSGPGQIQLGPLALTRAMCPPGSLHDRIVKHWPYVRSFVLKDGHLFLSLMADGGIYEFEPI